MANTSIKLDQSVRLTLAQDMANFLREIRVIDEVELLGHLVGYYVYAALESGCTVDQAMEAVKRTWDEPTT